MIQAERKMGSSVATVVVTPKIVAEWKLPPFQRPLSETAKVRKAAEWIRDHDGAWPGIVTLGIVGDSDVRYVVDGQHRRQSFLLSGCEKGYVHIRLYCARSVGDMAEEFRRINGYLLKLTSNDDLRAMEPAFPVLKYLRGECPFMGYTKWRQGSAQVLGMTTAVKAWFVAEKEMPSPYGKTSDMVEQLTHEAAGDLAKCLNIFHEMWGDSDDVQMLYKNLNLTLCMWIYRRMVSTNNETRLDDQLKATHLTKVEWETALGALMTPSHIAWLRGRNLNEHVMSPGFGRIKNLMSSAVNAKRSEKAKFVAPTWASHLMKR